MASSQRDAPSTQAADATASRNENDAEVEDAAASTNNGSGNDASTQDTISGQNSTATQPSISSETVGQAAATAAGPRDIAQDIADVEARIPQKKDATLREFLGKMDDYAPIIPDAVTNHYLTLAGLPPPPTTPQPLARLLALAAQKFVADIAADAYQYARIRSTHTTSNTANAMMGVSMGLPGQSTTGGLPGQASKEGDKGKGAMGLGMARPGYGGSSSGGQGKTVLTMEDLGMAVGEYGVNVKRGEFYR